MNATFPEPEGRCAITVMAKAPRPGQVKTRLVPPLSADEAGALSASFLRDITENLSEAARHCAIDAYIAYAPAGAEALFDGMLAAGTRLVLADGAGEMPAGVTGFGRCLLQATERLFARGYAAVCLLNSDSPTLPTAQLVRAAEALAGQPEGIVLGPAQDGGYYLIGMTRTHAPLFEDIAWSTPRVAEQTRARARALHLAIVELVPWYDVDDAATLGRLLRELRTAPGEGPLAPYPAPATAAAIEGLCLDDLLAASPGARSL
jgi:uncharacterized protein